ncbi:Dabb family protein [Baaleninema simplex]|uniref:Dabb family protein n=1 Tax=Baaleninema simplex TaxID=2862350 RepID=UPI0011819EFB
MKPSVVFMFGATLLSLGGGDRIEIAQSNPEFRDSLVRHIVLVDLKSKVPNSQIEELFETGEVQLAKIPGVVTVDFGRKARGDRPVHISDYDIAVYMEFESLEDLDRYQSHPIHQEFLKDNQHLWNGLQVLDFYGNPSL